MRRPILRSALLLALLGLVAGLSGAGSRLSEGDAADPDERTGDDLLIVSTNGWETDFSRHTVPLVELRSGGPGRDGIPDLDRPRVTTVEAASRWLDPQEPVIEVTVGGEARAYPLQILVWHEIVNDTVGDRPVLVTYCPLCNSALTFDRRVDGTALSFGTTGNLRHTNLVMYDRETESWWQQLDGTAIVGELAGAELEAIAAPLRAWRDFARDHPDGTVVSRRTGHRRPYGSNPYVGLDNPRRSATDCATQAVLGGAHTCATSSDGRLPARERVALIEHEGDAVAIPFRDLRRERTARVRVGDEPLVVSWSPGQRSPFADSDGGVGKEVGTAEVASAASGTPVPASTPFWFAVAAANPGIRIWTPSGGGP